MRRGRSVQPAKDGDGQKSLLRFYAREIERNRSRGKLHYIDPDLIDDIIKVIRQTDPGKNRDARKMLEDIEITCYAARRFHMEKEFELYFKRMIGIAKLIRHLLREL